MTELNTQPLLSSTACRLALTAALSAALVLAAGCSSQKPVTSPRSGAAPAASSSTGGLKIALITNGPVTDHGWNQSAYDAVQAVGKDLGAKVSNQEVDNIAQVKSAFQGYAQQGYDLIIAHGDEDNEPAADIAPQFPKVMFVTTGGDKTGPNLASIDFATEDGCYIQGMEAGMLSKTGKAGFIGGEALPPVKRAVDAFEAGMKAAKPSSVVEITYINTWDDLQKARASAASLISIGADMLAHNCDAAAAGMFQTAAAKPGVYSFGVYSDQNSVAPNVLSSTVLDIPHAFESVAKSVQNHTFKGSVLKMSMGTGDIHVADNPKFASLYSPAQKAKLAQTEKDISTGKIVTGGTQ